MQCPSCEFQNLPGSDSCGRCATSLRLAASAALDIHPPRASGKGGLFRRINVALDKFARGLMESSSRFAAHRLDWRMPPPGIVPRMILPGWSQLHAGQRIRGWVYLTCFVACILLSIINLRTNIGGIMLGLAFYIHSTAALDMLMQLTPRSGILTRIGWSLVISVVLGAVLYLPAMYLLN
jgi:hypothetical protein